METLTPKEVAALLRVTTRCLRNRVAAGSFPQPVRLSSKVLLWPRDQVETFLRGDRS